MQRFINLRNSYNYEIIIPCYFAIQTYYMTEFADWEEASRRLMQVEGLEVRRALFLCSDSLEETWKHQN